MKKISIIVPVYNAENMIENCVNSILNQTLDDFEIILIDDGSIDKSGDICEKLQKENNNVFCYHKKNGGSASEARNYGIKVSKGEFVCFVDNDDMLPHKEILSKMYTNIISTKSDMLIGRKKLFDYIKKDQSMQHLKKTYNGKFLLKYMIDNDVYEGTVWSNLYKKDLIIGNDLWFKNGLINEDEDFFLKILYLSKKVMILNENCYKRGTNIFSQTNSKNTYTYYRKAYGRITVASSIINFIDSKEKNILYKKPVYTRAIQFYLAAMAINIKYLKRTAYFKQINKLLRENDYVIKKAKVLKKRKYLVIYYIYTYSFQRFFILYLLLNRKGG